MGCDIHAFVEHKVDGKWVPVDISIFDWRSYSMFGILANVRNYSQYIPIKERVPWPDGCVNDQFHSETWYTLKELIDFNYDQIIENRRYSRQVSENFFDGGATCEPGQGEMTTYSEALGLAYFKDLAKLCYIDSNYDNVRILIGFDS